MPRVLPDVRYGLVGTTPPLLPSPDRRVAVPQTPTWLNLGVLAEGSSRNKRTVGTYYVSATRRGATLLHACTTCKGATPLCSTSSNTARDLCLYPAGWPVHVLSAGMRFPKDSLSAPSHHLSLEYCVLPPNRLGMLLLCTEGCCESNSSADVLRI
jgi:hypothetical protein